MRNFVITVNGTQYAVAVEEVAAGAAPVCSVYGYSKAWNDRYIFCSYPSEYRNSYGRISYASVNRTGSGRYDRSG